MRTLLLISRYFPPMFDVGGKRPFRFARYLHHHGWRTVVWTSQISEGRPVDPTPLSLPPDVRVVREYRSRWQREPKGRLSDGTCSTPVADRHERRAWFEIPVDRDIWWTPRMLYRLRRVVDVERPDAIFATSSPYSVLIAAALLKKTTGLPLCLDLRDPWTLNFLHKRRPAWVRRLDRAVEKGVFRVADRVVFTCKSAATAYREHYPNLPKEKFTTITNSFDPAQRPARQTREGPISLVHFGNCYGPRRLTPVLEAIARLREQQRIEPEQIRVLNLGRIAADDLDRAARLGVADCLQHRPAVSYEDGLSLLAAADLQILLPYGEETLFVPAKFYDYLLTGTPILCLAPPSELTEYVEATGSGQWTEAEDIEGIAGIIAKAIEARRSGSSRYTPQIDVIDRFSALQTTAKLAKLLNELVDE